VFNLDGYLRRIGLSGPARLAEIHRAHVTSIPFENLDSYRGVAVSLELENLERKLVDQRRGGYCFEHNLLLAAALEQLGASVEPMLARVAWSVPPGTDRPLTHMLLRVTVEGRTWHADVGFGNGTLLDPIPFGPGGPYEQSGWAFRVVRDEDELILQTLATGAWRDVYRFLPRPVKRVDLELSNWFTCSHPESQFVNRLVVARTDADGTRTALSNFSGNLKLMIHTPNGDRDRPVTDGDLPNLVEQQFGLPSGLLERAQ
jgi:N-hydroxyarylamine O-acetyltransferase